ncbi:MAG: protein BatD [Pontiellaceae bacterium]|nr:protein BatD [Pontiellaceae bacterium]MBN2786622.1 protein BatD [Pontiellaceae bacterium]
MKAKIVQWKYAWLGLLSLLLAGTAFAADVKVTIEPNLISLLDRAVLKVEFIDTKGESVDIPSVEGLKIEHMGSDRQYRMIQGKTTSSITHKYLITPSKVGTFSIGPIIAKYKGGEKKLTAQLKVIKPEDDEEAQQISEMMFSSVETDRTSPYVHEPFTLKLKVYVRDGIQLDGRFGLQGGIPESGLDGEPSWDIVNQNREERDRKIYTVYTLTSTIKTLTAGTFSFRPEIQLNVVVPRQQRRPFGMDDPFFGDLFGRQETRPVILDCNRLDIQVQPIPEDGRPDSFTGGVGILDFQVSAGPTRLKAGEPVTVKMRITGEGNLEKIMPPEVKSIEGLKCYDVRTVSTDNPQEVCFEQVVIPGSDDIKELPEIAFSYFNTQTADFRTIRRGPFPLNVEPSARASAQVMAPVDTALVRETRVLGHDIAYLKPAPEQWTQNDGPANRTEEAIRMVYLLPALITALAGWISLRRQRLANNEALARRQKAPGIARKHLQDAEKAIRKNDPAAFYEALWNALCAYFAHRFNLSAGAISGATVAERIPEEKEVIEQLFSAIEQRRYGIRDNTESPADMTENLRRLTTLLKTCERMKR